LAAGPGVRPLLRVPGRRHPPVLSRAGRRHHRVEPERTPEEGYHFTEDLVDKAAAFIADAKQVAPNKPFSLYFATGAMHAPHHVPTEWADRYQGVFDDGWEAYRDKVFARQKELGIVPADAELSRHDPDVARWADCSPEERRLYARMMEVFAGFLEHTDHHIGRLLDFLRELGELDNTLIMVLSTAGGPSAPGPGHRSPSRASRLGPRCRPRP
jgi:arylsulfatase A-like enzyme